MVSYNNKKEKLFLRQNWKIYNVMLDTKNIWNTVKITTMYFNIFYDVANFYHLHVWCLARQAV